MSKVNPAPLEKKSLTGPVRNINIRGQEQKVKNSPGEPVSIIFSNGVNDFVKLSHEIAKSKGWWQGDRNDAELIALMHSELSEALEAMREHKPQVEIAEELADCCIRIFDFCGARGIDLETAIAKKLEYNKNRPFRHGNKKY